MGRVYDDISEEQALWIGEQPMFFVATAAPDAHVNVSPRGLDTFRARSPGTERLPGAHHRGGRVRRRRLRVQIPEHEHGCPE